MTLTMADSIYAASLPPGYDAYAGYVDGHWPDVAQIAAQDGGKPVLRIAVFPADDGDCLDIETGDATPAQAPAWTQRQLARGLARPAAYASISVMAEVLAELTAAGIARTSVRLWSAHYGLGPHICGPAAINGQPCYPGAVQCDGTQHTSTQPGAGGSDIDASELADDFFTGAAPAGAVTTATVAAVPPAKRNVLTPVEADGDFGPLTCKAMQFVVFNGDLADCDGIDGPQTKEHLQEHLGVKVDGDVGPLTVEALQRRVGAKVDGDWGSLTTGALQRALNAGTF